MVARRGGVGTCISVSHEWDRHGQSLGWLVDAHGPVDHASVGHAQARPNYVDSGPTQLHSCVGRQGYPVLQIQVAPYRYPFAGRN